MEVNGYNQHASLKKTSQASYIHVCACITIIRKLYND